MPNELQGDLLHAGIDISNGKIDFYQTATKPFYINGKQSSQIESIEVEIGLTPLLASVTTPVELVPTPGALKALKFHGAEWFLDYGSVAITAGAGKDQVIIYDSGADVSLAIDDALFIVLTADTHYYTPAIDGLVVANKALQFETTGSGNMTNGTGSVLQIKVYYEIVTLMT